MFSRFGFPKLDAFFFCAARHRSRSTASSGRSSCLFLCSGKWRSLCCTRTLSLGSPPSWIRSGFPSLSLCRLFLFFRFRVFGSCVLVCQLLYAVRGPCHRRVRLLEAHRFSRRFCFVGRFGVVGLCVLVCQIGPCRRIVRLHGAGRLFRRFRFVGLYAVR